MPIPVVCGNCQTRLNAPDAAAGKKVRCPKCQAVMSVPAAAAPPPPPPPDLDNPFAFDPSASSPPPPPPPSRRSGAEPRPTSRPAPPPPPPEPEAAPPAAAGGGGSFDFGAAVSSAASPRDRDRGDRGERADRGDRPRRRRDEDDAPPPAGDRPRRRPRDDDADAPEDDDRPRGRRRPDGEKKKSPLMLLLLGGGLLLLVCCGGGGVVGYLAVGKIKEAAEKARAENDAKQKQIDDARKKLEPGDGGGGGSVPAGWTKYEAPDKSFTGYFPARPREEAQPQRGPKTSTPVVKQYMAEGPADDVMAGLIVIQFPAGVPAGQRTATMGVMASMFAAKSEGKAAPRDVPWLGQTGKESVMREPGGSGEVVIRQVLVGSTGYVGVVGFKAGRKQDQVDGFFNNIEPLSK